MHVAAASTIAGAQARRGFSTAASVRASAATAITGSRYRVAEKANRPCAAGSLGAPVTGDDAHRTTPATTVADASATRRRGTASTASAPGQEQQSAAEVIQVHL